MNHAPRSTGAALACAVVSLLAASDSRAASQVIQAVSGSRELVLRNDNSQAVVVHPKGELVIKARPGTRFWSLVEAPDGYFVAATWGNEAGSHILVLKGNDAFTAVQPAPAEGGGKYRDEPQLLAQGQNLVGMVWLEGDGQGAYRIMAADWEKTQWGDARELAPKGPGSQLGLTACVLADGSWLIAWAGFDGKDDEIWWTHVVKGVASKPARVSADNAVPDVTPAIMATAHGALLAWSRYDGNDYRLALASFAEDAFREVPVESGKGSTEPSFADVGGAPVLLYSSVKPEGFTLLKLDPTTGKTVSTASLGGRAVSARPGVHADGNNGVVARWEGTESSKALWSVAP